MASDEIIIRNVAKPTLRLDQLVVPNRTGRGNEGAPAAQDSDEKSFGAYVPVVFINGYYVHKFMPYFNLDMTGFLPVVRLQFTMQNSLFIGVAYPKDGDVISVYIRSWIEVYKPIRMDFNILSVRSSQSTSSEGNGMTFNILGEAKIPGLYSEVSKAFRTKTSYDTLFDVSQLLNLGFSTNDANLDDEMTWICPNLSTYDFIKEVTSRSYKNDRSFFTSWIDPYYNLTFINLENQLSATNYIQDVKVISGMGTGNANDTSFPGINNTLQDTPLFLTNQKGSFDLPTYILNYTLISQAGNITNNRGYVQEVQFYDDGFKTDDPVKKYINYTIETTTTENVSENVVLQKGRAIENDYIKDIRKNWYGSLNDEDGPGGVHENFIQALIQNKFNKEDLNKFTLKIETLGYYNGIYRGQAIPVIIYVNDQGLRKVNTGASNNENVEEIINPVVDRFLSGVYILMGIELKYEAHRGIYQVLHLRKRDWTLNSAGKFPKAFPINLINE